MKLYKLQHSFGGKQRKSLNLEYSDLIQKAASAGFYYPISSSKVVPIFDAMSRMD